MSIRMKKTGVFARVALLAAVFILMSAQAVLADDTTRFVPGTKVNGIGIGGLTVDEAKAQIESFYSAEYKLTIKERDGKTETLKGGDLGYKAVDFPLFWMRRTHRDVCQVLRRIIPTP